MRAYAVQENWKIVKNRFEELTMLLQKLTDQLKNQENQTLRILQNHLKSWYRSTGFIIKILTHFLEREPSGQVASTHLLSILDAQITLVSKVLNNTSWLLPDELDLEINEIDVLLDDHQYLADFAGEYRTLRLASFLPQDHPGISSQRRLAEEIAFLEFLRSVKASFPAHDMQFPHNRRTTSVLNDLIALQTQIICISREKRLK